MTARYEHDCTLCKPLGTHHEFDLYYCPQHGLPTVLARYGNEPWEYTSGMLSYDSNSELGEAKKRAIAAGLAAGQAAR